LLPEIDLECLSLLSRALEKMQSAYRSGRSYADPQNLMDIPTEAFNSSQATK